MESLILSSSDWKKDFRPHLRYAYQKSSYYLFKSAKAFKLNPSQQEQKVLQVLFAVMVFIDDKIDSSSSKEDRKEFQDKVIRRILYSQTNNAFPLAIDEMMTYLLKNIRSNRDRIDLSRTVQAVFTQSERIRKASSAKELFQLTKEEGLLTSELVLLFIEKSTPDFTAFVEDLSKAGDVIDTLLDFKRDWKANIISVKPTFRNLLVYFFCSLKTCGAFLKHCIRRPKLFLLTGVFFFNWVCRMFRRKFFPKSL